jgi:hypothetical protein
VVIKLENYRITYDELGLLCSVLSGSIRVAVLLAEHRIFAYRASSCPLPTPVYGQGPQRPYPRNTGCWFQVFNIVGVGLARLCPIRPYSSSRREQLGACDSNTTYSYVCITLKIVWNVRQRADKLLYLDIPLSGPGWLVGKARLPFG